MLYRLLRHLKYDVQYVRNFTDVDDKIIKRAAESGEDPLALSARFITEFHKDMTDLGCLPPTVSNKQLADSLTYCICMLPILSPHLAAACCCIWHRLCAGSATSVLDLAAYCPLLQ